VELPKRTKIAGGVLVLGLIALGVDRLTGGPAPASAASDAAGATNPTAPAKQEGAAQKDAAPQSRGALADRLDQLRSNQGARLDAFIAPTEWFPPPPKKPITETAKTTEQVRVQYHLKALMKVGGSAVAMIDGHQLVLGDPARSEFKIPNTDGSTTVVRLLSVDDAARTATIDVDGKQVDLKLETRARSEESSGK
jgi:hypothetical protein